MFSGIILNIFQKNCFLSIIFLSEQFIHATFKINNEQKEQSKHDCKI